MSGFGDPFPVERQYMEQVTGLIKERDRLHFVIDVLQKRNIKLMKALGQIRDKDLEDASGFADQVIREIAAEAEGYRSQLGQDPPSQTTYEQLYSELAARREIEPDKERRHALGELMNECSLRIPTTGFPYVHS